MHTARRSDDGRIAPDPRRLNAGAVAPHAFVAFALLHRTLPRGGMIDARHLRPLAWGISGTIAALILGPRLLPY